MKHKNKSAFIISQIQQYDNDHWVHPWEDMEHNEEPNRIIIEHAKGVYLYDELGHELIDGQAGMWCVQIGYGREEMATAIAEQVLRMPYMSPFHATSEPSARLAKKLVDIAPGDLNHVFFTTGGSTAVDCALRFVTFYNNSPYARVR